MVTFVLGRRKTGKSTYLINEVNKVSLKNERGYLLVPEQSTLDVEMSIIKTLGSKGTLDIQVISFEKLGSLLFKKNERRTKALLKEQVQKMILRKVLKNLPLLYYRSGLYKEVVLEKILKSVKELKEGDYSLDSLKVLENNKVLYEKIKELHLIKEAYEAELTGDYIDEVTYGNLLIDSIITSDFGLNTHFYIDDFFSFSKTQLAIIKTLIKHCKTVTIALPLGKNDRGYFEAVNVLYGQLKKHCKLEKIEYETIHLKETHYQKPVLSFIERAITHYGASYYSSNQEGIVVKETGSPEIEVREVFETIAQLVKEKNYSFEDMKIVCNDLDTYRNLFKLYRDIYNIPIFMDEEIWVHTHPIIQFVLLILDSIESNNTKVIMSLLKTGWVPMERDAIETLEIYVREYGIENYKWQYPFREEGAELARQAILGFLNEARTYIKEKSNFREKIKGLYSFLEKIQLYEQLIEKIENYKAEGKYKNVYIDTQIWNILLDTFDQCVLFLGNEKSDLKELSSIFKSSFLTEKINILPTGLHEVLILGSQDMFKERAKCIFIIGASDGIFPSPIDKKSLFKSQELKLLDEVFGWHNSYLWQKKNKDMEVYFSLTGAVEYLYISYSLGDRKGEGQTLSLRIIALLKKLPGVKKNYLLVEREHQLIISENKRFLDLMEAIGKGCIEGEDYKSYCYFKESNVFGPLLNGLFDFKKHFEFEGNISNVVTDALFFKSQLPSFSVSKIEKYASCPYAFFIQYGLRPLIYKGSKINNLDIGNIYHKALETFQEFYILETLDQDTIIKKGQEVFNSLYEADGYLDKFYTFSSHYRLEKIKSVGLENLILLMEQLKTDDFKPTYFELAFGKNQLMRPIVRNINGQAIALKGKIDRVDLLEESDVVYSKIIDYKLNDKELDYGKFYDGISLQLFFYLNALMEKGQALFPNKKLKPGALLYFVLNEEKLVIDVKKDLDKTYTQYRLKGEVLNNRAIIERMPVEFLPITFTKFDTLSKTSSVLSEEDFYNCTEHVQVKIDESLKGILKGDFKVNPYYYKAREEKYCTYCQFNSICKNKLKYNYLTPKKKEIVLDSIKKDNENVD